MPPEKRWPDRLPLKNKRGGGIECIGIAAKSIRALYTAGLKWGARFHEARARPTASETQLGLSGTYTLGVPGCGPAQAVLGARPAAPAEA